MNHLGGRNISARKRFFSLNASDVGKARMFLVEERDKREREREKRERKRETREKERGNGKMKS